MAKHSRPTPVIILMCVMCCKTKNYGIWKQENGLIADILKRRKNAVMVCYPF